jgi:hypothetical protein
VNATTNRLPLYEEEKRIGKRRQVGVMNKERNRRREVTLSATITGTSCSFSSPHCDLGNQRTTKTCKEDKKWRKKTREANHQAM